VFAALATAIVFLIRTATPGMHKLLPDKSKRSSLLFACSVWMLLSAAVLAGLGSVLSAITHHRGLGGTTFALVGVGVIVACAVIAVRSSQLLAKASQRTAIAWTAFGIACAAIGALVLLAVKRANADGNGAAALAVADAALIALLCIGTSRIRLPNVHKRIWVPTAVLLLVGIVGWGVSTLDRLAVAPKAREQVLLLSPVLDLIAKPDAHPKRLTHSPIEPP